MKTQNIYLIHVSDQSESFFKIGVSVHRYCRFYEIMKTYPNVTITHMVFGLDPYVAMNAESLIKSSFVRYIPEKWFGGYTECFKDIDLILYKNIIRKLGIKGFETVTNLPITWR